MNQNKVWDYKSYAGYEMYPHLFQSIKLGKLEIPNRIKYAATEDNLNAEDGFVTDADVSYIQERAEGVVGGICTIQGVYMDPKGEGRGYIGQAAAWDDKFIPGLKRLADAIHEKGALANYQLMHCGRVGGIELPYCVGPSKVPQRLRVLKPMKPMNKDDIKRCVQEHADATRRGIEAGFDIIEISGIVGYLISNFLSSFTNRRTDEYGGDIEGRCRFMVEVIEAVREEIGNDVPLIIRICAEELLDEYGGNTAEECMVTYKMAEDAGVDCVSVTQGWQESLPSVISRDIPQGYWLYNAKRAKEAGIRVPLSMAYRLFTPDLAEKAIADGTIDIWEMCRPMIADPLMPKKVLEGRLEDIRPCIACNLCLARLFRDVPMTCAVNPRCAHEWDPDWEIKPVETKKKVMIIGGGATGLECARAAALRGHEVHLYESRGQLGGQLIAAREGPYGDEELYGVIDFLKAQCEKAGVNLYLNTTVTKKMIDEELPDTVVIATGAKFVRKKVPGYDRSNVVVLPDVLEDKVEVGEKVLIVGGAGHVPGISGALYLTKKKGKKVTLLSKERKAGFYVNPSYVWRYIVKLRNQGVTVYTKSDVEEITDTGAVIEAAYNTRIRVEVDTVVFAERESEDELLSYAKRICPEVYVGGDALKPRRLKNAIHDGYRIGIRI